MPFRELQRRNSELAEAVAARDTFIAVVAHELRNPMTPMVGQTDTLLSGFETGITPGSKSRRGWNESITS